MKGRALAKENKSVGTHEIKHFPKLLSTTAWTGTGAEGSSLLLSIAHFHIHVISPLLLAQTFIQLHNEPDHSTYQTWNKLGQVHYIVAQALRLTEGALRL